MAINVEDIELRDGMQFNTIQDDILYVLLSQSELASEITGIIKKGKRPTRKQGAKEEDCTIESLDIPAGSVQLGTSNVNIYVPDILDETVPNATDYDEDTGRIKHLAGLAFKVLEKHYCERGWGFRTVMQGVFAEPAIQSHRIWFKVRFFFHN